MACDAPYSYLLTADDGTTSCENYTDALEAMAGLLGDDAVIDSGNTAWMLAASALVMLMTPGLAFFYGGLVGEETASNTIMMSMVSMAIVSVQWLLFGYSLAFGPGSAVIGSFQYFGFMNVGEAPSGAYGYAIPHTVFAIFQCMFAQITPALISGAVVGRMKFSAFCVFVLVWTTLIYDPIAHWVWAFEVDPETYLPVATGWLGVQGAIDFAGGTVIHISSGFAALAAVLVLGKRYNHNETMKPHNVPLVMLGASLLWFGWFGFNSASAVAADGIASVAFTNTHIATAAGFITWMLMELIFERKVTPTGAASGAVAALVSITPGCGFVKPSASIVFGVAPGVLCYLAVRVKRLVRLDDTLDAFCIHGVGGVIGALLTGIFATKEINFGEGLVDGNSQLIVNQVIAVSASAGYSFVGTLIILFVLKLTMGIRVDEEVEKGGIDSFTHGGFAYTTKLGQGQAFKEDTMVAPAEN